MFDTIRKRLNRRRALRQIAGLDRHLREDIGMGHVQDPGRDVPVLLLRHGPFDRTGR